MSSDIITRSVVGGPMTLTLGKPVGQHFDKPRSATALRWEDGHWVGQGVGVIPRMPKIWRFSGPQTFRLPTRVNGRAFGIRAAFGAGAFVILALGAGAGLMLRHSAETSAALPIAAPAAELSGVKVVTTAYEPTSDVRGPVQALPIVAAMARTEPAPLGAAASVPAALPVPAPAPLAGAMPASLPAAAPSVAKAAPVKGVTAPSAEAQPKLPAVVLDEVASAPIKPTAQPNALSKPAAAIAKPDLAHKAPIAATPPLAQRGTGLVAITPDGKFALFTNPKTRLPEQFKVGDQLPGGETVRNIYHEEGKVLTSSKEYHLD
jgi:hypothetical protein